MQLYAATKASNELMQVIIIYITFYWLRFFTYMGNGAGQIWQLLLQNIIENKPVLLFNNGNNFRDFIFDDAVAAINNSINYIKTKNFEIFNVGNNKNINVKEYLKVIELT